MKRRYHIGKNELTEVLEKQAKDGQVPHSQLFIDAEGYGGLPFALSISEIILGQNAPQKISHIHDHPDLHFVFPTLMIGKNASWEREWRAFCTERPYNSVYDWLETLGAGNKQGSIRVETVLDVQQKASLKAFSGKNKVFIIWGANLILEKAANKLLKLLEEPPSNTYFLLVAEHTDKMLPTILSRCQITKFQPIAADTLLFQAKKEYPLENRLEEFVNAANGSWRRLTYTIERFEEIQKMEQLWVDGLRLAFRARGNKKIVLSLFEWAQGIAQQPRESQKYFLLYGLDLIRDALMIQYNAEAVQQFVSFTGFSLEKFAAYVHSENIIELKQLFEDSYFELGRNANPKILFSCFSLSLSRLLNRHESTLAENIN